MRRNYPTVSVIIPVYNASQYLQRCVDSVLNQSFDDIEVILVDDGSIDSSSEICDRFAKDDERVKVVHQSNQGVSAARNRGLSYATGTWLSFVDADDSLLPGLYEEGINAALSSIEIVMFEELRESRKEHLEEVENTGLERLSLTNSKTYPHIHHQVWNYLIRREYWQKSNVWFKPYAYAEDILFLYELLSSGGAILHIKKPYYVYNDMNDSATSSISYSKNLDHLKVAEEIARLSYHNKFFAQYLCSGLIHRYTYVHSKNLAEGWLSGYRNMWNAIRLSRCSLKALFKDNHPRLYIRYPLLLLTFYLVKYHIIREKYPF